MSRTVELPENVFAALQEAARRSAASAADWIAAHLPTPGAADVLNVQPDNGWLDHDFLKTYAHETDGAMSLEAVRQTMGKIPGRLADDIRIERDEG